jgi:hypothetical protein
MDVWSLGGKKVITRERRWYKDIGLGYKTPQEAINGTYIGQYFVFNSKTWDSVRSTGLAT